MMARQSFFLKIYNYGAEVARMDFQFSLRSNMGFIIHVKVDCSQPLTHAVVTFRVLLTWTFFCVCGIQSHSCCHHTKDYWRQLLTHVVIMFHVMLTGTIVGCHHAEDDCSQPLTHLVFTFHILLSAITRRMIAASYWSMWSSRFMFCWHELLPAIMQNTF